MQEAVILMSESAYCNNTEELIATFLLYCSFGELEFHDECTFGEISLWILCDHLIKDVNLCVEKLLDQN